MLLSYQPALLFVHIEKAAGSSIQIALRPFLPPQKDQHWRRRLGWLGSLNRLGLYKAMEFPEHAPASAVQRCLPPAIYARLYKFAFVRNPWDRLVSRHAHLLRSTNRRRHHMIRRMENFEDYIAWEIKRGGAEQAKYVLGKGGRGIVDFVGRYEKLHEDFALICNRLGIKAQLPHANVSTHRDYRSYYTPATRDLVAKHFQKDIELFGYNFDGLDPKNPGRFRAAELPR